MGKGQRFPTESRAIVDAETGVKIRQLTNHRAHSHHLYFTNSGWYDGGRRLVFASDRLGRPNLFSVELPGGEITQLTDIDPASLGPHNSFLFASLDPRRPALYFWRGDALVDLALDTLEERILYRLPPGFLGNMTSVTADGRFVCTAIFQDLSGQFPVDLLNGYVGFRQYWEAMPLSRVLRIDTAAGGVETLFEERYWIGHCNASPGLAHILTFCHEGPWNQVDHRMWGLDMGTGAVWKIRPRAPREQIGHEHWLADGEHIAYHGRVGTDQPVFGQVRYDGSGQIEVGFSADSTHFHGNSLELVVGDGTRDNPRLMLWSRRNGVFQGPRLLLTHRGSFHTQVLHAHPRLTADAKQVLFASDHSGYGNLYLAELPPFDSLPLCHDPGRRTA